MNHLLVLAIAHIVCPRPAPATNVVVIMADQLAEWATDPAQRAPLELPNIDALASAGMRCTSCYALSPVCAADRLAILSGRSPFTLGVEKLAPTVPSMGTIFEAAGWDTGYVGKWHLSPDATPTWGPHPGYVKPANRPGWRFFAGSEGAPHNYTDGHAYLQDSTRAISTAPWEPTWQTAQAIRFLEESREDPFLLVVSYGPPHPSWNADYQPPQKRYRTNQITPRPNVPPASLDEARKRIAGYMGLAAAIDDEIGVLLEDIDLANTLVVFTSDHGDMLLSHGTTLQKRLPWEESAKVPLIVAGPGVEPGTVEERTITTLDLLPSVLGLAGVPMPGDLEGEVLPFGRAAYFGMDSESNSWNDERWRAVVDGGYKYAETETGAGVLLYDLEVDPYELKDLSADPAQAERVASMHAQLVAHAAETGDPFFEADGESVDTGSSHPR